MSYFIKVIFKLFIIYFLLNHLIIYANCVDLSSVKNFLSQITSDNPDSDQNSALIRGTIYVKGNKEYRKLVIKSVCNEDDLMQELAKLCIISPEKVLLKVTSLTNPKTCCTIRKILINIRSSFKNCEPPEADCLYTKLWKSLKIFNYEFCRSNSIDECHLNCLAGLGEDFINCEGKPDWFDDKCLDSVCKTFIDIIDCYYISTSQRCGDKAACSLRSRAIKIFKPFLPSDCSMALQQKIINERAIAMVYAYDKQISLAFFYCLLANFIAVIIVLCCLLGCWLKKIKRIKCRAKR